MNLLEDQVIADRESPERKAEKQANELLALKVQELEESLGNVKEIDQSKKLWEEIGKLWDGLKEHRDGIVHVQGRLAMQQRGGDGDFDHLGFGELAHLIDRHTGKPVHNRRRARATKASQCCIRLATPGILQQMRRRQGQ